jgi:tetratricopeptide (TPR) repeat protein
LELGRVQRPHPESVRLLADALGLAGAERAVLEAAVQDQQWAAEGQPLAAASAASAVPAGSVAGGGIGWGVVAAQLPHDVAGFTGRADELEQLRALFAGGGRAGATVVISAIDGVAGIGKTALAVHVAHQLAGRFADAQLYVDLRGFDPRQSPLQPGAALSHLLRGLGVDPRRVPSDLDDQVGMYRSLLAGRRALVVLDNAATAEQVRPLLPGGSDCAVLVTSRNRLSGLVVRDGARRLALDLLPEADAVALLAGILGAERVAAEPAAAVELARLCGRLPLALRIAADRAAAGPRRALADLVAALDVERDRLDLLATPDADQTTAVRAVFSWSYHALPAAAARAFRLLGLHAGPDIEARAAAALLGADVPRAQALLDALATAHLIEEHRPGRYRLHDLVRLYAAEQAAAEEPEPDRAAAVARLLHWYLHTAAATDGLLSPQRRAVPLGRPAPGAAPLAFTAPAQAADWCEAELPNLIAAVEQASQAGQHATAWKLPIALSGYFSLRKHWSDWIATHQAGLAAEHARDPHGQACILIGLGLAHFELRRFDEALDCHQRALDRWAEVGDIWGQGITLMNLGNDCTVLRRLDEALDHYQNALALAREINDRRLECIVLNNLGEAYRELGRHTEALDHQQKALALFREIGDPRNQGHALNGLGQTCHNMGRTADAIDHFRQALTVRREIGDQWGQAESLAGLATAMLDAGQPDAARQSWQAALAIFADLGDPQADEIRAQLDKLPPLRLH